jgi:hypothetical protein
MTRYTLSSLSSVELNAASKAMLAAAESRTSGDAVWRRRKLREIRTLLALCQEAPYRLKLRYMDIESETLRLVLALNCPVPLEPFAGGPLRQAVAAELAIVYPREVMLEPMKGTSFLEVLRPSEVFHPNIAAGEHQRMCLGATLRNFPLVELIVLSYASLAFQVATIDRFDPAGVLNPEAARFFEERPDALPLTREPFLRAAGAAPARQSVGVSHE